MKFKFLEHTADMKFQAFGKSLEEAFSNSAYALSEIITKDKIKSKIKKIIKVNGKDNQSLLYNFLEEFLFLIDTENLILSRIIRIKINKKYDLIAEAYFDNIHNYKTITDIKAITYNDMQIKQENKKFVIQAVVDV